MPNFIKKNFTHFHLHFHFHCRHTKSAFSTVLNNKGLERERVLVSNVLIDK